MKTYTEWAIEWPELDEDGEPTGVVEDYEPVENLSKARQIVSQYPVWRGRVVYRTVTITPWKYDVRDQPQG
jgi:hypothetical protein